MTKVDKVVMNTGVLYAKMLLTAGISFYTTRIVLDVLGVTDFGLYNLVLGLTVMLSFISGAMSISTQRYLSYYKGTGDLNMQQKIFSHSLVLHCCLSLLLIIILEVGGIFLFDGVLNIPIDRLDAAKTIYHFMALSVMFSVLATPFIASINANENMIAIAIINIVEVLFKLLLAFILLYDLIDVDNLIFYSIGITIISFISLVMYVLYALIKYKECSLYIYTKIHRPLLFELTSFAGWNLFGSLCGVGKVQGVAIILNVFLGTTVNAAYGVATQIAGQINFFSVTMLRALNPQIMKSEGEGDRPKMLKLSLIASKFGFFLLALIAIPCVFEMSSILKFWLKFVPDHTVIFCQLVVISLMVSQLTIGLQSAIQATGKIRGYQITIGSFLLLNIPIAYFLLSAGFPAYSVLLGSILIEAFACCLRMLFLKYKANLSLNLYFKSVLFKLVFPVTINIVFCWGVSYINHTQYTFLLTLALSPIVFVVSMYVLGLSSDEKQYLNDKIIRKIIK